MSQPTLDELIAQEEAKLKSAKAAPKPTTAGRPEQVARRVSNSSPDIYNVDDVEIDGFGAFAIGAADTVTFGFLDEAGAFVDTNMPEWLGGNGLSYKENLRRNRSIMGKAEDESGGAYLSGQLVGGFVPVAGVGGKAQAAYSAWKNGRKAQVGYMALAGAAQGAAYGFGSAESEDLLTSERFQSAATMGAFGAGAGLFLGTALFQGSRLVQHGYRAAVGFRTGKSPKLDFDYAPIGGRATKASEADQADFDALRTTVGRKKPTPSGDQAAPVKKPTNWMTGKAADEVADDAIAPATEMLDQTKRGALIDKLTKLTPQQAKVAAQKLQEAVDSGDLTKEPHFASIAGLDLAEFGDEADLIPEVSKILAELFEGVRNKAGEGARSTLSWERQLRARYGSSLNEAQLDAAVEKMKAAEGTATVGKLQMVLAGVKFARVSRSLMPEVMKGDQTARELLAEELSTALSISAKGQLLVSGAGRELGMLKHSTSLVFRELGDGYEVETIEQIRKRVNDAMQHLDDDGLNELLAQTRDMSHLEEISKVLLDPARAEKVGLWMRMRNTFESFIKSNTLTPATAAINLVGVPIHNWVRNSGARLLAEATARAGGDIPTATMLMMQRQAASAVRWHAHLEGIKGAVRRMKWEAWGSWKNIAGVAGLEKSALKASASRQALIARGYKPPPIREFDLKKRLSVSDVRGFNARLAERAASDAPFAHFVNGLERAGATVVNTIDALGTATAKVASGVIDDYGRAMIMTKEVYAEMASKATAEGLNQGLSGKKLADHVSKRAKEWASLPPEDILAKVERKLIDGEGLDDVDQMLLRRDYGAEREAERVLFLDGPQTSKGRALASVADGADTVAGLGAFKGILMPYIQTPTRILERGLASYTPWGHLTKEVSDELAKGGTEAALERARMDLGGTIISAGMLAAATGAITVTNGPDYRNSKNLGGAPANRVNFPGGGYVEFGRLEPLAMGFAMGGIVGQMYKAAQEAGDQYGQDDALAEAKAIAYGGFRDALLEKSYLTGLSDLYEAISSNDASVLESYFTKFSGDAVARVIPLSGTSRQLKETISGKSVEAVSWLDRLAKVTPGMGGYLPARVDALGNEISGRTMGIAIGSTGDLDPVTARMRELGVDIQSLKKADPTGFDLTSEELSDLRSIRATRARNADGQTMKEALHVLFSSPEFQTLPDKSMVQDEVVRVMRDFNQPARQIYETENQQYLADRVAQRSLKEYIKSGIENQDARRKAREEVTATGLPDPYRVIQ
jgi:hypothetical protein